jgi:hypothetical protein
MPATLSCMISKIVTIPNKVNADIVSQYQEYMRDNGASFKILSFLFTVSVDPNRLHASAYFAMIFNVYRSPLPPYSRFPKLCHVTSPN